MDNKKITVNKILEICNGILLSGNIEQEVKTYSKDTRTIEKNDMYIGIKGEKIDGNNYLQDALEKGALGCITDRDVNSELIKKYNEKIIIRVDDTVDAIQKIAKYKRSLYNIPVIAVTGSVGKTSTKDIIANVLSQKYKVLKTEGNLNNHIGLPLTLLKLNDHTAVVVEMGMNHFKEISVLTNIAKPTGCVITNIGTSHIGNLGSRENILKAKLEILEGLNEDGFILINNDNDLLSEWARKNSKYKIYTYGVENKSTYMAVNIKENEGYSVFNINNKEIKVPVAGLHFVYNGICAFGIGELLNIKEDEIQKGILEFKLSEKRMSIETIRNNIKIINDSYNASYDSMKAALEVTHKLVATRKIAVLGNMFELGEYSKHLHEEVGNEVVKNEIDILITIGEYAKDIAKKAKELGMEKIYIFEEKRNATNYIKKIVKEGDLILLKASNAMNFSEILEQLKNN